MSIDVRPEQLPADDVVPADLVRRVYAFFHNKRVGLVIILVLGVLTLLGVLFPQAPDTVRGDPQAWASWLDQVRPRFRGWTDPLALLGVFGMFSSWWFRITTIMLVLSIIACTTHRAPLLWRQAMHPHTHVTDSFFDHARLHGTVALSVAPGEALETVRTQLGAKRFKTTVSERDGVLDVYADRNRLAPFGTVVAHTAFVIILLGVFITSTFGYRDDSFTVPVGSRVELGHDGLAVEAAAFSDTYNADGTPADYASHLVLYAHGERVAEQTVRVNSPLNWGGWSFNQASFGTAAQVLVTDASGATVLDQGIPLEWLTGDETQTYGKVLVPGTELELYVVTPASGKVGRDIAAGQARLELYRVDSSEPVATQVVDQGRAAQLGEHTFTFVRERQYTGLMASRDPGAPWVWVGSFLLALGTCLTMFWRHHRVWVRITGVEGGGSQVRLASPDRHDSTFESQFRSLVQGLRPGSTH